MEVHPILCLKDNYAYLIVDKETHMAACVDPVEPEKVISLAKDLNVNLTMGICTHRHWDHSDIGITPLKKLLIVESMNEREICTALPDLVMLGSAYESIPGVNKTIKDGETTQLGNLTIKAFHVPCHTVGHELFYITSPKAVPPVLFTGDTLFVGGCGRFFEGTANDMHYALNFVIANLPPDTLIYCGHEYTVTNLSFGVKVDGANEKLKKKLAWAKDQIQKKLATVPSTIAEEIATNPFMRVNALKATFSKSDSFTDVDCMQKLRSMKDAFKL